MEKLFAFLAVLRKGSEVSDVEAWKKHQINGNLIAGLIIALVALAKAFGYELPVDDKAALSIGGGIVTVINIMLTAATSKRAGILPAKPAPVDQPATDAGTEVPKQADFWADRDTDPTKF